MDSIDKIDVILKQKSISGVKMTSDLGMSNSIYSQWKRKSRVPSVRTLRTIADYLGVTLADIAPDYGEDSAKIIPVAESNEDVWEYLDMLRNRPECRMLLKTAKNATAEEVKANVAVIEAIRKAHNNDD